MAHEARGEEKKTIARGESQKKFRKGNQGKKVTHFKSYLTKEIEKKKNTRHEQKINCGGHSGGGKT